jgi:hypothetical protein
VQRHGDAGANGFRESTRMPDDAQRPSRAQGAAAAAFELAPPNFDVHPRSLLRTFAVRATSL